MSNYEDLERAGKKLKKMAEQRELSYSQRVELEREARIVLEEAKRQRDVYVNWLWGH